jgi:hypothetical protein
MASKKPIPFNFVFEYLEPLPYTVKPFFGCHGVYVGNKIMLILRERADHTEVNGVWLATTHEHHESLRTIFPSMQSVSILNNGEGETAWQMIPLSANDFESSVLELCQMIRRKDVRIGRVPKKRKK